MNNEFNAFKQFVSQVRECGTGTIAPEYERDWERQEIVVFAYSEGNKNYYKLAEFGEKYAEAHKL